MSALRRFPTHAESSQLQERVTDHHPRSAPLLGPSLGPILGGVLTQGFNWRATFWFLAIFTGLCVLSFVPFKDTFRKERSTTYQIVLRRVLAQQAAKSAELSTRASVDEKKDVPQSGDTQRDVESQTHELTASDPVKEVKLTLKDVNPVGPIIHVLSRRNNVAILFGSGDAYVSTGFFHTLIPQHRPTVCI